MNKIRVDVYIKPRNYFKLLEFMSKTDAKTASIAVDSILEKHFAAQLEQQQAVDRLTKVIQGYESKIQNLEFELRERNVKTKSNPKEERCEPEILRKT